MGTKEGKFFSGQDKPDYFALSQIWAKRFVESLQASPFGDMARWVGIGIEWGLIKNDRQSKKRLASQMGQIFSFAFKEDGSEFYLEDLNLVDMAKITGIEEKQVKDIAHFMVRLGILKSRMVSRENNENSS